MDGAGGINGAAPLPPHTQAGKVDAKGKDSPEEMKKALQDFEALFINQMLTVMRQSVGKSDMFHGGSGEEIYTSLFDTELSKLMSKNGGMGLGNMLMEQLGGGADAPLSVTGEKTATEADALKKVLNIQLGRSALKKGLY